MVGARELERLLEAGSSLLVGAVGQNGTCRSAAGHARDVLRGRTHCHDSVSRIDQECGPRRRLDRLTQNCASDVCVMVCQTPLFLRSCNRWHSSP